jgi:hypothetical protein
VENEAWWVNEFNNSGWEIIKDCNHVNGLKDNWNYIENGNHVFLLKVR